MGNRVFPLILNGGKGDETDWEDDACESGIKITTGKKASKGSRKSPRTPELNHAKDNRI
jgi:hypothetical protein